MRKKLKLYCEICLETKKKGQRMKSAKNLLITLFLLSLIGCGKGNKIDTPHLISIEENVTVPQDNDNGAEENDSPNVNDSSDSDTDGDMLNNLKEKELGLDPNYPNLFKLTPHNVKLNINNKNKRILNITHSKNIKFTNQIINKRILNDNIKDDDIFMFINNPYFLRNNSYKHQVLTLMNKVDFCKDICNTSLSFTLPNKYAKYIENITNIKVKVFLIDNNTKNIEKTIQIDVSDKAVYDIKENSFSISSISLDLNQDDVYQIFTGNILLNVSVADFQYELGLDKHSYKETLHNIYQKMKGLIISESDNNNFIFHSHDTSLAETLRNNGYLVTKNKNNIVSINGIFNNTKSLKTEIYPEKGLWKQRNSKNLTLISYIKKIDHEQLIRNKPQLISDKGDEIIFSNLLLKNKIIIELKREQQDYKEERKTQNINYQIPKYGAPQIVGHLTHAPQLPYKIQGHTCRGKHSNQQNETYTCFIREPNGLYKSYFYMREKRKCQIVNSKVMTVAKRTFSIRDIKDLYVYKEGLKFPLINFSSKIFRQDNIIFIEIDLNKLGREDFKIVTTKHSLSLINGIADTNCPQANFCRGNKPNNCNNISRYSKSDRRTYISESNIFVRYIMN